MGGPVASRMLRAGSQHPCLIAYNNQQSWGGPCQPHGKLTYNCTGFNANLPGNGIQRLIQGKYGMAPAVGWSPSSTWSCACEWGDADCRAGSRNAETTASRIMAPQIHSSPPPSGTLYHLLEHSWPPQRYIVCETQTAGEGLSPPDRCSDEFLGVGTQTSFHWLGQSICRCLLVPALLGDVCLIFPGTAENHMGWGHLLLLQPGLTASGWGPCTRCCGRAGNQINCCPTAGWGKGERCDSPVKYKIVS